MAKQHKTSTGALIAIVAVVALLLAYIMLENGGEPLNPVSTTTLPAKVRTEPTAEEMRSDLTISAPETGAPALNVSSTDIEAILSDLDATLDETEYDTSSVTELFEEDTTSELIQPYEL